MLNCNLGQLVTVEARAKVNLALDIMGIKGNMHLIDTVIVPIGLADTISIKVSDKFQIEYSDGRRYQDDTALKAAKLISSYYGTPPVSISIIKRIPEGKGLGGSSADAAGVARAMQKLFGLAQISSRLLLEVGSDVPAMYQDRPVRVKGLGEKVSELEPLDFYGVLLTPDYTISTREAYGQYDSIGGAKADIDGFLEGLSPAVNSLERAALALEPRLKTLKDILDNSCYDEVVMTGSGSGFIGFTKHLSQHTKAKKHLESLNLDSLGITIYGLEAHYTEWICQKTN